MSVATRSIGRPEAGASARVGLPRPALDHLNWLRGVAAVAVLVGHVRGLFFVDFEDVPRRSAGLAAFYLFSGMGHEAVIVFFVLSGFYIGTSVLGVTDPRPFSWARFLLHRFTRLYVVLLPALLLTALWDSAGVRLFGAEGNIYAGEFPGKHVVLNDVRRTIGLPTLLGNLAFLQDFFVHPYGSNGPLWSLSYEFWFYLVFPLLVGAGPVGAGRWRRAAMAAAALAIVLAGGGTFLLYFLIWAMGAFVARYWPRLGPPPGRWPGVWAPLAGGLFLAIVVAARARLLGPAWRCDLALGAATSLFVAVLLSVARHARAADGSVPAPALLTRLRDAYARLGDALANCSYTLYLVHYPPLVFLYAWAIRSSRSAPAAPQVLAACAIALGVLVLYAYPVSRLTEANTDRVRKSIGRAVGVDRRAVDAERVPLLH